MLSIKLNHEEICGDIPEEKQKIKPFIDRYNWD